MNNHSTSEHRSGVYHHFNRTPHQGKKDVRQQRGQTQMAEGSAGPRSELNQRRTSPRAPFRDGLGPDGDRGASGKGPGGVQHGQRSMSITHDPAQASQSGTNQSPDAIVSPKGMYPSHSVLTSNPENINDIEGQIERMNARDRNGTLDYSGTTADQRDLKNRGSFPAGIGDKMGQRSHQQVPLEGALQKLQGDAPVPAAATYNMRMQAGAAQSRSSAIRNHAKAGEQAHATSGTFGLNLEGGLANANSGQQAVFNPRTSSRRQQQLERERSNATGAAISSPSLKASTSKRVSGRSSIRAPVAEAAAHEYTDTALGAAASRRGGAAGRPPRALHNMK